MGNIESQEDENETINLEDVQNQIYNLSPEQIKILKQKLNISNSTKNKVKIDKIKSNTKTTATKTRNDKYGISSI